MSLFDYGGDTDAEEPPEQAFLATVSDAGWLRFTSYCEVRRYAAGALVVKAGQVDRSLCVVLSGEIGVRVPAGNRRGATEQRLGSGSVVGEVAFFDGRPRSADIVAIGDVELLALSFANFERLAALEPLLGHQLLLDLGRALAHRLRATNALIGGAT